MTSIEHYTILSRIDSGGMGTVYRAQDTRTGHSVAIKLLRPDTLAVDPNLLERFRREGEALRQLNHPNIVKMIDAFEDDGQHYLVMEYIDGSDLKAYMRDNELTIERVLNFAIDIADALTRAHRLNIVHRDIKPANILIAPDNTVFLTDFGVAQLGKDASALTTDKGLVGTVAYISPEACRGDDVDTRTDIWSFGVLLFEMLSGQLPFTGANTMAILTSILFKPTPDLEALVPDAPIALIDLIYRMLIKNPDERIPSVRVVGMELEAILLGDISLGYKIPTHSVPEDKTVITGRRFDTSTPARGFPNHNLPAQTTPFVGREAELEELTQSIENSEVRLITILGPGGIGKSRLALEFAGKLLPRFANGIYLIELAPLSDSANIVSEIGKELNYPFQQDNRSLLEQLIDFLRTKDMLLVLDNFEHLLEGTHIVHQILRHAPDVRIVVTTRQRLNLTGETVIHLGGMDFPEWNSTRDAFSYSAVKLFLNSAQRVQPGFGLETQDLTHVSTICRLVQGMPLGILLAASWLDMLTLQEIAEEIEKSIDFLDHDMSDLPERQHSIRAVFDYSLDMLTGQEQAVFMKLSVFRGGFTREAVQKVTGANLRMLQALVNKSLLRRDAESGRYEIHELVRQYAAELLKNANLVDETRQAHSIYYAQTVKKLVPKLKGDDQTAALNTFEEELDNISASWRWAVDRKYEDAIRDMWEGLFLFANARSRFKFASELFKRAQQGWPIDTPSPSVLHIQLATRFPNSDGPEIYETGLAIAEQLNDMHEVACCKRLLGHHLSHAMFQHDEGIALLEESLFLFEELGDDFSAAYSLDDLGWSHRLAGREAEGIDCIQKCLNLRRKIGDKIGTANALRNMGGAFGGFASKREESEMYWAMARDLSIELRDRLGIAWNSFLLASYWFYQGDFAKSKALIGEGLPIASDINDPVVKGVTQALLGMITVIDDGDIRKGKELVMDGFPPGTPLDFRGPIAFAAQAVIACEEENNRTALNAITRFIKSWAMDYYRSDTIMWCGGPVAVVLARSGRETDAVAMMSQRIHNKYYAMAWVDHWQLYQDVKAQLKAKLGADAFETHWEQGKSLDFEKLVGDILAMASGN